MLFSKSDKMKEMVGGHTDAVVLCYSIYSDSLNAILNGTTTQVIAGFTSELRRQESFADEIRRKIIRQLLEGGLIVDSRKSIMHVIEAVDEVADLAEDIIQEIYIQGIELPGFTHAALRSMVEVTGRQLDLLIGLVKDVVDKYKAKEMTQTILQIEGLESEVDDIQQDLVKQLFETELALAKKMQLREIINMVGKMSDVIEDISDEIEIIMMARTV